MYVCYGTQLSGGQKHALSESLFLECSFQSVGSIVVETHPRVKALELSMEHQSVVTRQELQCAFSLVVACRF